MADILLIHGAMHGSWCWDRLRPELERHGHHTHVLDLPIETAGTTLDVYADVVAAELDRLPGPAWLVGHSMGGMVAPRAALKRQAAGLVLLCTVPPDLSERHQQENLTAVAVERVADFVTANGLQTLGSAKAAQHFFGACRADLQAWAAARLRPQSAAALESRTPLPMFPDVPMHAILTRDDALLHAEPMAALYRRRMNLEPVMLPGDHSPFVCCPDLLAQTIDAMVRR